jgi:hypothetical protein
MGLKLPSTHVNMDDIRNKYHAAEQGQSINANGKTEKKSE